MGRFRTDGIRGESGLYPVDRQGGTELGRALGECYGEQGIGSAVIVEDPRATSDELAKAISLGVRQVGMDSERIGVAPTPAVAYLTGEDQIGVSITASHCPMPDNGMKVFGPGGMKLSVDTERHIDGLMGTVPIRPGEYGRSTVRRDRVNDYVDFLRSTAGPNPDTLFSGMRLVIDTANGSASHIAPGLFESLGAQVVALNNQPDGHNINKDCGAADEEVGLPYLAARVQAESADAGIAFDGDADRVAITGLDGDDLLYILAHDATKPRGVAGTVMANLGLERALADMDIPFYRADVGDRNVLYKMREHGLDLGGEQSGHVITEHLMTGDGMLTAIQVMKRVGESGLSIEGWRRKLDAYRVPQRNINLVVPDQARVGHPEVVEAIDELTEHYRDRAHVLVRASGTQKDVVRVMVQADDVDAVLDDALGRLSPLLGVA